MSTSSPAAGPAPFVSEPATVPTYRLTAPLVGFEVQLLASSTLTGGSIAVMGITLEDGKGIGMHIHTKEDELVYVVEGTLIMVIAGVRHVAGPGTLLFGPRNVPHGYVAKGRCRITETFNPGGLEQFFVGDATLISGVPVPLNPPTDPRATGIQMIGPVPSV